MERVFYYNSATVSIRRLCRIFYAPNMPAYATMLLSSIMLKIMPAEFAKAYGTGKIIMITHVVVNAYTRVL